MRGVVLPDQALAKRAGQFAWLSIDTDRPANAAFNAKFPSTGVPLFLIIDPVTEQAVLSWYGTASVAQLQRLLDDGLAAGKPKKPGSPEALLAQGDALNVAGKLKDAATVYLQALRAGGKTWSRYSRAAESMMLAHELSGERVGCVKSAMEVAPTLARDQSFVNVMRIGIQCASYEREETVNGRPQYSADPAHYGVLRPLALEALKIPGGFADDKAVIYGTLISSARTAKDDAAVKSLASEMWTFLEREAAAAPNAQARSALNGFRRTAAMELGDIARVVPILEASERELPDDYNPPQGLASIYQQLGRIDDAISAFERAAVKARGEGARSAQLLLSCARLKLAKGDIAGVRASLDQLSKLVETLPESQASVYRTRIQEMLAKLKG